jgi:serine protease AprX
MRVPTRHLGKIAALPFVAHLSADMAVKKCDEFTTEASGANSAYQDYGFTGKGVGVAMIDSGIYPYADLANGNAAGNRVTYAPCFVPGEYSPADACGHGTHVAGIIAGIGQASIGPSYTHTYYGIARQANIIGVRVLDAQGQGSVTTTISGIQWAVQNKSVYNIRVINLSLGHPVGESCTTDPLCQAVEAAWKAGIVVVCAAGNSGRASTTQKAGAANEGWGTTYGTINSPGNDPYVITVGATKSMDGNRWHDRIATYSGRGPSRLDLILKPDIIAPGNKVIALGTALSYLYSNFAATNQIPLSTYCPGAHGMTSHTYFRLSGTSMAAPVVAGAAALMLQANPSLSPDTIKARLMISAGKWAAPDGTTDPCTYGAGYLDIPAALQNTAVATKRALSPALTQDASGNVYLDASGIMSALHIIWGTSINDLHIIWGTSVFSDHIIWGTSTSAVDLTSTAIYGE